MLLCIIGNSCHGVFDSNVVVAKSRNIVRTSGGRILTAIVTRLDNYASGG